MINATVMLVANENGWNRGDVSVSWSVTDPESAFTVKWRFQVSITADTS